MKRISFAKWHGLGNDFILVDLTRPLPGVPIRTEAWRQLAPRLCDRHLGIGADGVLLLKAAPEADFEMIVVNADGSVAEMCGNGLRCVARFWGDRAGARHPQRVLTGAGIRLPELLADGRVRVDMGPPRLAPGDVPISGVAGPHAIDIRLDPPGLAVACVSMGNPHAVTFVSDLDRFDFDSLGRLVSTHERFPEGANAGFAQILGRHELKLAVWERGVGPTLACGTGACAAAVAGIVTDRVASPLIVHLAGGDLEVEWMPGRSVFMTGPAEPVFEGEFDPGRFEP